MEKKGLDKGGTQIVGNSTTSAPSTKASINETIWSLYVKKPHAQKLHPHPLHTLLHDLESIFLANTALLGEW